MTQNKQIDKLVARERCVLVEKEACGSRTVKVSSQNASHRALNSSFKENPRTKTLPRDGARFAGYRKNQEFTATGSRFRVLKSNAVASD